MPAVLAAATPALFAYTDSFNRSYQQLEVLEGFESNDAGDPGGHTILGITEKYWPKWFARLQAEPTWGGRRCIAKQFYWSEFWTPRHLDNLNQYIAYEVFEMAVNTPGGCSDVVKGVLETCGGCDTLQECVEQWGVLPVVLEFNLRQYDWYYDNPNTKFFKGWTRRVFDNLRRWREMVGRT